MSNLEQRVIAALREGDQRPVDIDAGRANLLGVVGQVRAESVRGRRAGAMAAAAVLLLLLSGAMVINLRLSEPPVRPTPASTRASGLPIGRLSANVLISDGAHEPTTNVFSLMVNSDGTGRYTAPFMPAEDFYPVRFVGSASGVVRVVRLDPGTCAGRTDVTLHFVRIKVGIRITAVDPAGCFTEPDVARQLAGTVLTWYPTPTGDH
jgi:hypothetical protein